MERAPAPVTKAHSDPAYIDSMTGPDTFRLTQVARGGGCACKIPPGELEETVSKLVPDGRART